MRPRLTLTGRRRAISSRDRIPALVCGSSPQSSAIRHERSTYSAVVRWPELGERRAIAPEGQLGLVAEAHERFDAALGARRAAPRLDVGRRHRPRVGIVGILAERAVRAAVATEVGDREEDLRRVGDDVAPVGVTPCARDVEQGLGARRIRQQRDRLVAGGREPARRAPQARRTDPHGQPAGCRLRATP